MSGRLVTTDDRSAHLADVRRDLGATAARPAPGEPAEDWIARTFSLAFDYSWPQRR